MTDYPITPPPELVQQWRNLPEYTSQLRMMSSVTLTTEKLQDIATQAARWGADQELEACCEWLGDAPVVYNDNGDLHPGPYLRDARRSKPKPPSKEEALDELYISFDRGYLIKEAADTIRRALEALPE
jgi:hypothetical protein